MTTTPCTKCKPEMGLHCGACAVRQHAKEINTDRQVCALREYVMAARAADRARRELAQALGLNPNFQNLAMEMVADEIVDSDIDPREIDVKALAVLRKRVLYA